MPITFEEVRTRLAELSRDGKTAQVRELIAKFGATKLSEVDKKHYPAIMDGAVEIAAANSRTRHLSARWLNCPSARLSEEIQDTAEGTDAHALCEYKLRKALGGSPWTLPI